MTNFKMMDMAELAAKVKDREARVLAEGRDVEWYYFADRMRAELSKRSHQDGRKEELEVRLLAGENFGPDRGVLHLLLELDRLGIQLTGG